MMKMKVSYHGYHRHGLRGTDRGAYFMIRDKFAYFLIKTYVVGAHSFESPHLRRF